MKIFARRQALAFRLANGKIKIFPLITPEEMANFENVESDLAVSLIRDGFIEYSAALKHLGITGTGGSKK